MHYFILPLNAVVVAEAAAGDYVTSGFKIGFMI